ncbi:MAG: VanZ family protein [Acidobacteria bacterium]|nr:VanZ family protein [Acidobacteriota bacterium]
MAAIFMLSAMPGGPSELPIPDYLLHFSVYGILGFLLYRALDGGVRGVLGAALLGAFYGMTDEFHQSFVPGRDPSLSDWIADAAGSGLLSYITWRLGGWLDRRRLTLAACALVIAGLVPLIATAHQALPSASTLIVRAALVIAPACAGLALWKAGLGRRQLLLLASSAIAIQGSMFALHLTFQEMLHLYEYGLLGYLYIALAPPSFQPSYAGSVAFSGLVALADEFFQWIWPGRAGEIKDVGEDVLFAALGAAIAVWLLPSATSRRTPLLTRWAMAGLGALATAAGLFVWQVHSGYGESAHQVTYLTVRTGMAWPPRSVIRKEAMSHVRCRNELYEAGRYGPAAAENLLLETSYAEFLFGHRYSPEQLTRLPNPAPPYASAVPEQIYFTRR